LGINRRQRIPDEKIAYESRFSPKRLDKTHAERTNSSRSYTNMKRDFRLYLQEIFDAVDEIEEFTKGFTVTDFVNNKMAVRAIITDLIIIGEAVDMIPNGLN
jgi:hypothetical protein